MEISCYVKCLQISIMHSHQEIRYQLLYRDEDRNCSGLDLSLVDFRVVEVERCRWVDGDLVEVGVVGIEVAEPVV